MFTHTHFSRHIHVCMYGVQYAYITHLISGEKCGRSQKLGDTPEGIRLPRLSRSQVQGRDQVVVAEAGVRAGPQESLDSFHVTAEHGIVEWAPSGLVEKEERGQQIAGKKIHDFRLRSRRKEASNSPRHVVYATTIDAPTDSRFARPRMHYRMMEKGDM